MATDRKADHYTSAQNYTDLDGMSKSFTFIDHDKKTSISTSSIDAQEAVNQLMWYKQKVLKAIIDLPASACPDIFSDFTLRGEEGIRWNFTMLSDAGLPLQKLTDLLTLTQNRIEVYGG